MKFESLSAVVFILLVNRAVDFRSRRFAFRGAGDEPPRRESACGVSPVPLIPQESLRLPFQPTGFGTILFRPPFVDKLKRRMARRFSSFST
ncbi:hypothetical protein [Bacillus sp. PK3_68]|uniref:hypothetical protein n=1 Tax=Bacillus sp. PK3_68 TaxID=2027408 RepID=UPI00115CBB41|nr:hypothetical protein [Bacillus sp. PK3_68]